MDYNNIVAVLAGLNAPSDFSSVRVRCRHCSAVREISGEQFRQVVGNLGLGYNCHCGHFVSMVRPGDDVTFSPRISETKPTVLPPGMIEVSQAGDAERGVSNILVALRWDGPPLSRQQLQSRASNAIAKVDPKYNKDVMDVKALEINEAQQYVQLSVRADFSSDDEKARMRDDLKAAFSS